MSRFGIQATLARAAGMILACCAIGSLALLLSGIHGTGATTRAFAQLPFLDMWIRWDAGWYQGIATDGYYFSTAQQSSVAYFPLYPMSIRALVWAGVNPFVAGIALTVLCGLAAACLFSQWARALAGPEVGDRATRLLLLWPFAFFLYGAVYSDAMYLALAIGAFLCLERRLVGAATLLGAFATATRPIAPALAIGLVIRNLELRRRSGEAVRARDLLPALSLLGMAAYMIFLAERFGDPLAFLKAQRAWSQEPGLGSLFKIEFFSRVFAMRSYADLILPLFHAGLAIAFLGLVIPIYRLLGAGYAVYAAAVIGVALLSSRNFIGLGRYCLAAFPCFLTLALVLEHRPRARRAWTVLSAVLLAAMVSQFAIGRYVS